MELGSCVVHVKSFTKISSAPEQTGTGGALPKIVPSDGFMMYHVMLATLKCTSIAGLLGC